VESTIIGSEELEPEDGREIDQELKPIDPEA
jgi:hypothetical protein